MTFPFKIVTELQKKRCEEIREMDAEYYKKLEAAGASKRDELCDFCDHSCEDFAWTLEKMTLPTS